MQAKIRASPDFYAHGDEASAMSDLRERIVHYEASYESCSPAEGAYIQLHDLSARAVVNDCYGPPAAIHA